MKDNASDSTTTSPSALALAKHLAWTDRSRHDVSRDKDHLWDNLVKEYQQRYVNMAARAAQFYERIA